ncbi:Rab GTPase-binding effector protein 1, partial [Ataeniobius toweri]|nr:Rab GTPase-binding effector protein 1 [Ataeniobius toweri]
MAEEAEGSPLSSQHDEVLQQRVAALEQEKAEFIQFKQQLDVEFNQKRAKFKELFLSKEEELKRQTVALENSQSELSSLQAQLAQAQAEIETIKAVATVSENTKQEAIDQVRSQWQEEVASLQAIMKDTVCEYEVQFHQRLEQERAQWNQYREAMERELGDLRRHLTEVQEEENLEVEMKKAQEDAEKLRSVVMPMEQEITVLKAKLSTAEERVKELEASK